MRQKGNKNILKCFNKSTRRTHTNAKPYSEKDYPMPFKEYVEIMIFRHCLFPTPLASSHLLTVKVEEDRTKS